MIGRDYREGSGRESGQGRTLTTIALTVVACVLVWLLLGRGGHEAAPPVTVASVATEGQRVGNGEFPHTCEGAVAAYTAYYRELNTAEVSLNPERTEAFVEATFTGSYRDQMKRIGLPELRRYAEGAIGDQYHAGVQTIYQGTPIGWRINSCEQDEVEVQLWTLGIRANATNVWPMQFWNTRISEMVWKDGTWRISGGHTEDGPVPYWTQRPLANRPANMADVMKRTRGMRAFVVALPSDESGAGK